MAKGLYVEGVITNSQTKQSRRVTVRAEELLYGQLVRFEPAPDSDLGVYRGMFGTIVWRGAVRPDADNCPCTIRLREQEYDGAGRVLETGKCFSVSAYFSDIVPIITE